MLLGARQFFERRGAPTPPLPYDAEVNYLESTGTQWIDTGFAPTSQSKVECDAQWMLTAQASGSGINPTLFGARLGSPFTMYEVLQDVGDKIYYQYGNSSPYVVTQYGVRRRYLADGNRLLIDDNVMITAPASAFSITYPLALLALNNNGTAVRFAQARVFRFKAWEATGTLVRDFIPVRFTNELGQSEGAMYDRANPTVGMNPDGSPRTDGLYRNSGTGAFTWAEKQ